MRKHRSGPARGALMVSGNIVMAYSLLDVDKSGADDED